MSWEGPFTFAFVRELLDIARASCELRELGQGVDALAATQRPALVIRHDVDLSLQRALALAEIEARAGVHATFLVMVDCPLYDLDDPASRAILDRLRELGHAVGLHMDLGPRGDRPGLHIDEVEPEIAACRDRMATILGEPPGAISFHRPADPLVAALADPPEVCGMVNAYHSALMRCYLADSAGSWRHGDPRPTLRTPPSETVQLLLHPFWWGEEDLTAAERLEAFYRERTRGMAPFDALSFDRMLATVVRRARRSGLLAPTEVPTR